MPTPASLSHSNSTVSYAAKLKRKIKPLTDMEYPDEEKPIIFQHIGDTKITDYLKASLPLINDPKAIIAASRVANNRVIIFLDSLDRVNKLFAEHQNFTLGNHIITFRKLRSPTQKIILSNISPSTPNSIIGNYLT